MPKKGNMEVTASSPSDWTYVSEGGATIVFSYVGPPDPRFHGKVLRIRKVPHAGRVDTQEDEPDDPTIAFQYQYMQRLIPPVHLPQLQTVSLSKQWLEELSALQDASRPSERRAKDGINVNSKKGVLATDLIGRQGVAVEIKPKWGFLPLPDHLSLDTKTVKLQTCRFCMHSHLKASQGDLVAVGFCPLDLFSKDQDRIARSISALWDAWVSTDGAINNLKIFVDGKTLKPSTDIALLTAKLPLADGDVAHSKQAFVNTIIHLLCTTPVLETLSRLQRTLDSLDVEGLSALWLQAHAFDTDVTVPVPIPVGVSSTKVQLSNPSVADWTEFIDQYLSDEFQRSLTRSQPQVQHLRYYMLAYLLSASFKDCSIMMRLAQGDEQVTVIDLDPKGLERLQKWEVMDKEIASHYALVDPKDRRTCTDDYRQ